LSVSVCHFYTFTASPIYNPYGILVTYRFIIPTGFW